jgi:hypothetical protein
MTKFTVKLDPDFISGSLNTVEFKDVPHLNTEQLQSVADFVDAVSQGAALKGKNKPSWLDDEQNLLPETQSYKEHNFWHYHCGPLYSKVRIKALTYHLGLNIDGMTSSEVIHYTKEDELVTIYAYSPTHIPFPKSDNPNKKHPLFEE